MTPSPKGRLIIDSVLQARRLPEGIVSARSPELVAAKFPRDVLDGFV